MLLASLNDERQVLKEKADQHHDHSFDITHGLPPEIVAHIFQVCIAEGHDSLRWNKRKTPLPFLLTAVCQRWRIIAHSTPRLWNTFSLLLQVSSYSSPTQSTLPLLLKEWINRTGELPLSIKLNVILKDRMLGTTTDKIINLLRHCSNRWINLEYDGPAEVLSYILGHEQDLPQLRTLHINGNVVVYTEEALNIRAKRLIALSITHIRLAWISFDWNHLTHLVMEYASPPECFEALLKARCLTHYTFRHSRQGPEDDEFFLPQNPIVHDTIQYLEISHAGILHERIFRHLSCPSLKTLFLDGANYDWDGVEMSVIVEFLRKSGCSLERLLLVHPQLSTLANVASLCHGIPTLQHLDAHFYDACASVTGLLVHLEEFSTVDGRKEPRYLPALRSLTLNSHTFSEWTMLPNIFGTSTLHSIKLERHRHSLESVMIFARVGSRSLVPDLVHEGHEETLKKILQLREAGVKLEVQFEDSRARKDGIDLAVEQYYGAKGV
ncbi:hypothetical protein BJ912DRAFT_987369 [Pholiota molesta]|nr:hypothetical protein BJ912DRAFT_987369 [Pholiota molesta]